MSDFVRSVKTDLDEAYLCGREAVRLAGEGETGNMVSIKRISDEPYKMVFDKVPLNKVAIAAKPMPLEYFNDEANYVSPAFINYMKPLIGELPEFVELEKVIVKT
jgi:6-phosphofructokinase 1